MTALSAVLERRLPGRGARLARLVVIGLVVGLGIAYLYWAILTWIGQVCAAPNECQLSDAAAYWHAGPPDPGGAPLYVPGSNVEAANIYRYAPWFAWATVPFTYLPYQLAGAVWSLVLVIASCAAVVPFAKRGEWLLVAFFWPILMGISAIGNVQAAHDRRADPGGRAEERPAVDCGGCLPQGGPDPLRAGLRGPARSGGGPWRPCSSPRRSSPPCCFTRLSGYTTDIGYAGLLITWLLIYVVAVAGPAC